MADSRVASLAHLAESKEPVRRRRATRGGSSDRVYNYLREMIVRGRISPGSRIVETDIALHLDVSRTPIRSALHRLRQEGYLVPIGRRKEHRLVIAPLTQDDAHELFHIVGMIEGLAAAEAARATKNDRSTLASDLEKLNLELTQVARSDTHLSQRVFETDMRFHRRYVEAGAGPRLLALHDAIKPQAERYVHLYAHLVGDDLSRSVEEHEAIVQRIANGNPDAASRAVQRNWRNAAARMQRLITLKGERGTW